MPVFQEQQIKHRPFEAKWLFSNLNKKEHFYTLSCRSKYLIMNNKNFNIWTRSIATCIKLLTLIQLQMITNFFLGFITTIHKYLVPDISQGSFLDRKLFPEDWHTFNCLVQLMLDLWNSNRNINLPRTRSW